MAKHEALNPKRADERRGFAAFKFKWQERIQRDAELPESACGLAIVLNHLLDAQTLAVTIGMDGLAKQCRMSTRNLRRVIDQMRDHGHLQIEARRGRGALNTFRPTIAPIDEKTGHPCPVFDNGKPDTSVTKTGRPCPPSLYIKPYLFPYGDLDQVSCGGKQRLGDEVKPRAQRLENQDSGDGERGQVVTERGVLVRISSDEAAAWLAHERRNNPSIRKLAFVDTPYGLGVWRETRWPPGYHAERPARAP